MENTIGRILRRSARGASAAAVLLGCASIACRTPDVSRRAAPVTVPPGAKPMEISAPLVVDVSPRVVNEAPARVVVTPSGGAYLVLRAGPEQLDDGSAWGVVYHAGDDAEAPARPGAEAGLVSVANELLEAFAPLADVAQVGRLSVTALFGKTGGIGVMERRWFARDAGRWRADGGARRFAVAPVPPIDAALVRHPEEEARARGAAVEFISDADRGDYDAAWSRTSALAKAIMSRTEFERRLSAFHHVGTAGGAEPYLAFPASGEWFLPGALVEAWLARKLVDGPGVQAVVLRLDDDMEWRVATVLEAKSDSASSVDPGPPRPGTEI
jgi:hypothetical protein